MKDYSEYIGQTFGRLYIKDVIFIKNKENRNKPHFVCSCNCGNDNFVAVIYDILYKKTVSCGCKNREMLCRTNRKSNDFDISGEFGIGITISCLEFYFDLEDFEKIKDYRWESSHGYIIATIDHKKISMQRFLMKEWSEYPRIDHKNRNKKDNRKSNLRVATFSENAYNRSLDKDNRYGVMGISIHLNKWVARIQKDRIKIHLGIFENKEDAIIARLKAEKEYFGEFAPQIHLFEQYGII